MPGWMRFSSVSRKFRDHPPGARVDQRKGLLAGVRVGAFGNGQVRHARVERRENLAPLQIVAAFLTAAPRLPLRNKGIEKSDAVRRLIELRIALLGSGLGFVLLREPPRPIAPRQGPAGRGLGARLPLHRSRGSAPDPTRSTVTNCLMSRGSSRSTLFSA